MLAIVTFLRPVPSIIHAKLFRVHGGQLQKARCVLACRSLRATSFFRVPTLSACASTKRSHPGEATKRSHLHLGLPPLLLATYLSLLSRLPRSWPSQKCAQQPLYQPWPSPQASSPTATGGPSIAIGLTARSPSLGRTTQPSLALVPRITNCRRSQHNWTKGSDF